MKATTTIIALAAAALISSDAFAQTNDHFARQRREATARRESQNSAARHWGGPTNNIRWYGNSASPQNRIRSNTGFGTNTVIRQNIQYVPVSPFGFGYPNYGYPRYGGYGGWNRGYGYGGFAPAYQHIHIHREIITR